LCSATIDYFSDLQLLPIEDKPEGQGQTYTKYEYGAGLSGIYSSIDRSISSRVTIENKGADWKNISISMVLEADGIEEKANEIFIASTDELGRRGKTKKDSVFTYLLPPETFFALDFQFDYNLREHSTLKQTILIGESEPKDVIVSQDLTRYRRTYNCVSGIGRGFYRWN